MASNNITTWIRRTIELFKRNFSFFVGLAAPLVLVGIILVADSEKFFGALGGWFPDAVSILALAATATGAMLAFLAPDKKEKRSAEHESIVVQRIEVPPQLQKEAFDNFLKKLEESSQADVIQRLSERIREADGLEDLAKSAASSSKRIDDELESLGRKGMLSLTLGVVAGFGGAGVLLYYVQPFLGSTTTIHDLIASFLPRLSVVVIIEVFAYFFLRMYKFTLSEIKYFHNEATNLEMLYAAATISVRKKDDESVRECIRAFTKIERNPILGKEQRRDSIDENRLFAAPTSMSLEHLKAILEIVMKADRSKDAK